MDAVGELDASVGVEDEVKLYGLTGVRGGARLYGHYAQAYDLGSATPTSCVVSAGLRLEEGLVAGLKLNLLGHDLEWDYTRQQDFPAYEKDLCPAGLSIATTELPDGVVGGDYAAALETADDRGGYWSLTDGDLPPGVSLSSAGELTGTPTTEGTYDLQVRFTDFDGNEATQDLSVVVRPRLRVLYDDLGAGVVGVPFAGSLEAYGGFGPYTWSVTSGAVPGVAVHDDGSLSGSPTETGSGDLDVVVTDASGATATATVHWQVDALPPPVDPGGGGGTVTVVPPPPACGAACGSTWGDPHLVTYDGQAYDAQRVGELVLTASTVDDLAVQVRQAPWRGSQVVSVNTAAAMDVDGDRVGLYLADGGVRTLVDGEALPAGTTTTTLPGGGRIDLDAAGRVATVTWPDGSFVSATYPDGSYLTMRVSLPAARQGHLVGLLGDSNGSAADDHVSRDGEVVPPGTPVADLLTRFVDTWRVTAAESLFDYAPGESTETFTDPQFPQVSVRAADLPDAQVQAAFSSCTAAGVVGQSALEACALDVALSGDAGLAAGAVFVQDGSAVDGDLVRDGGFERPVLGGRFTSLQTGASAGAWTVTSGSVDLVHKGYWAPAGGDQSVDLNSCSAGTVSQDLATQAGQRYAVRYAYAGNPETSDRLKHFHVEVDGAVLEERTFDTTGRSVSAMGWVTGVTSFVASGTTASLAFVSDQAGSCGGATLDEVSVTPLPLPPGVLARSTPGDQWTDATGATGASMLSYGHIGCPEVSAATLLCTSGAWPRTLTAPWVWAHQLTRDGEGAVTFTREVTVSAADAGQPLTLRAMGDDSVAVSVDGTQVISQGSQVVGTHRLSLDQGPHTLTFVVSNVGAHNRVQNPAGLSWSLTRG